MIDFEINLWSLFLVLGDYILLHHALILFFFFFYVNAKILLLMGILVMKRRYPE